MKATGDVKRSYRSSVREGQARDTRRALLAAAAKLFVERGYVATSVDEIALAAGVSRATVFNSVGGKAALLKGAYDIAIVGDDEQVGLVERPRSRAIRADPDPRAYLRRYSELATEINARVALLSEVVRGAAGADAEARALYEKMQRERLVGARHVVDDVRAKGGLRRGLKPADAIDIVWTLMEPTLYLRLVRERGWSPRRYARWFAATLEAQLLDARAAAEA